MLLSWNHLLITLFLIIYATYCNSYKTYDGYTLYDLKPQNKEHASRMRCFYLENRKLDFWVQTRVLGRKQQVLVPPPLKEKFKAFCKKFQIPQKVKIENIKDAIDKERAYQNRCKKPIFSANLGTRKQGNQAGIGPVIKNVHQFFRYNDILKILDSLEAAYPSRAKVVTVGRTYEKRDMKAIFLTNGDKKKKRMIFVDAGIHGREWLAPAVAMHIIKELCDNFAVNKHLLDAFDWFILPVTNPDGYEYTHTTDRLWRKTRKPTKTKGCFGGDANRNFDFHFGEAGVSKTPCDQTYLGDGPFSEYESAAIKNILHKYQTDICFYLSFHSYGQFMLFPTGYTKTRPPNYNYLMELATAGANAMKKKRGTQYTKGCLIDVLYAASGGAFDYAYGVEKIDNNITCELPGSGDAGFDPPTKDIKPACEETWEGVKEMAAVLKKKYANN